MQFSNRLVEIAGEQQERGESAQLHLATNYGVRPDKNGNNDAKSADQIHRRVVHCPNFHHHECGPAKIVTDAIESTVLVFFAGKASDLSNAGQIIVQQRVHCGGGAPLQSIAPVRGQGVPKRAGSEERHGAKREQGQLEAVVTHQHEYDHHLQQGHEPLLDAVDQHALHRGHIFKQPGHKIAGGPIVEPAQRK